MLQKPRRTPNQKDVWLNKTENVIDRTMYKFINSCFIRKNTPELIDKLIDLGYEPSWNSSDDKACIATSVYNDGRGTYTTIPEELFDSTNPYITWNCANRIDCGTDENLFLTLAGLKTKE